MKVTYKKIKGLLLENGFKKKLLFKEVISFKGFEYKTVGEKYIGKGFSVSFKKVGKATEVWFKNPKGKWMVDRDKSKLEDIYIVIVDLLAEEAQDE